MDFGVHLPLIAFDDEPFSIDSLIQVTRTTAQLGFQAISANDHLVFGHPWLDGLAALAAVSSYAGQMSLMTTVALPVVRGPVALAKSLTALDIFSKGRLIAGVGPGSSAKDYAAAGIAFGERWQRLDEAIQGLRALWQRDREPFRGRYYSTEDIVLEPDPVQPGGPPIWIGSWGSERGLRRVARLGDGWLASAYNTTPDQFKSALSQLQTYLIDAGRASPVFPNALATMFLYLTDDSAEAAHMLANVVAPVLNREASILRERLLIGSVDECVTKLKAYQEAGVQRVFIWPIADHVRQLTLFQEQVVPLISDS
jgi:alkanesulfonate monooxygenase SsuD/methylene tetrahydromethanopterin reductase-like flavin-dependent oxidoreductase (luciferase family)